MRGVIYIVVLLLLPYVCFAQDMSNSIGVLKIGSEYAEDSLTVSILNDDGSVWWSIDFYGDKFPYNKQLQILAFKPDYFLFKIKCIKETQDSWIVMVNENTGLTKTIRKDPVLVFQSWDTFILDVFSIEFNSSTNAACFEPQGEPLSVQPDKIKTIVPVEVKGDWLKIKWPKHEVPPYDPEEMLTAWIRWKKDGKIIIEVWHLC